VTVRSLAGGRYELERDLGRGGMARVVLAHDTSLDRRVAVKLLDDGSRADPELRERFLREGRFAAQLSHPNVVAVFDTGEEDGSPYIVMELVEGRSLAEEIGRRGALPAEELAAIGRQLCAGLDQAHARGLVHRDVKPQNLLLAHDGTLKVADFGIARSSSQAVTLTQAGTLLGTAAYMAPEVVRGAPATPESDVYSAGAVLYEVATGRPPRVVASLADLASDELITPPGELAELAPDLEEAVMRCLARDPAARPTVAELARELGDPTLSERPTLALRREQRARPRARVIALALTALVLVLAAAGLLLLRDDGPDPPPAVEPVPTNGPPAQDARNLSRWLRENAG
jgi:eukaryotic-like serine/threonine-protein kinase